jgi:hypothetical protein
MLRSGRVRQNGSSPSLSPNGPSRLPRPRRCSLSSRGSTVVVVVVALMAAVAFLMAVVSSVLQPDYGQEGSSTPSVQQQPGEGPKSSSSSSWQQQLPSPTPSESFSACLLVRDDNHFLVEWLLYHYLVVMVDPASRTSPARILARFQNWTDLEMVVWTKDDEYSTVDEFAAAQQIVRQFFGPQMGADLAMHRARQRLFYYRCMLHHQLQGRTWVALLDTDEFVRINYHTVQQQWQQRRLTPLRVPPITEPGSVLQLLQQVQTLTTAGNWSTPCIQVPRLRMAPRESLAAVVERVVPASLSQRRDDWNSSHLLTLRYRRHAAAHDYPSNRISKALVDVSRLTGPASSNNDHLDDTTVDLQPVTSIHRPVRRYCTQRGLHIRPKEQLWIIHHYLGTLEQYMYRKDPRLQQPEIRGAKVGPEAALASVCPEVGIFIVGATYILVVLLRSLSKRHT